MIPILYPLQNIRKSCAKKMHETLLFIFNLMFKIPLKKSIFSQEIKPQFLCILFNTKCIL